MNKKMTEEEMEQEIHRLHHVLEEQSETFKKFTGKGMFERVKTDGKGKVIVESDDIQQRKMWGIDDDE